MSRREYIIDSAGPAQTFGRGIRNILSAPNSLMLFAAYAWVSTAILMARSIPILQGVSEVEVGTGALAAFIAICASLRRPLPPISMNLRELISDRKFAVAILVVGILLRVIWTVTFRPEPMSDGLMYLHLAKQIVAGRGFGDAGAMAFWPPGYAFFLSAFLLFLSPPAAVFFSQTILFVIAAIGIYKVATTLGTSVSAGIALALFSLWPNLIALNGTPEKELLVTALLVWAVDAGIKGTKAYAGLAGVLLGCSALVQPATQLLIPLAAVALLLKFGARKWALFLFLVLGSAIVITPWTVRNFSLFGQFKLISTNGGDVLYRANNPLATGGYTVRGQADLSSLSELDHDTEAKILAVRWIKAYPADFIRLSFEKQILFMGDDAYGVYATFRSLGDKRNARTYMLLKSAANFWWLLIWLAAAVRVLQGHLVGRSAFLVFAWVYLFGLHAVFESGGRYHIPMVWVLCILFSSLFLGTSRTDAGVSNKTKVRKIA